jgi:putative transposase
MFKHRPRLDPALYLGFQRYFLTFCTAGRRTPFTRAEIVSQTRDQILQDARDLSMEIVAYCFMPDHVHLLVEGCTEDADLLAFAHRTKQMTGYGYAQRCGERLWQPSFWDRVLRHDEAAISVARYMFDNPVRAGLVTSPKDYPFLGSDRFTVDEILEATCWQP